MKLSHLVAVASITGALALAGPAFAGGHDDPQSPCPKGYTPVFDVFNVTGADENDNDVVCGKATPTGDVFVDDNP
jgi:hypothetical protein